MKLISCYIANFGGLSDRDFRFDPGLTTIMEPNGAGKTTLAEFIRAMFYGFPRANKALEKNRRKKYLPWQGGRYGGSLVFEHEGVQYRIERSFGERPASDTFSLYDLRTNQKSARFSQDIGLELFQLDADSFERSTYLPQLRADIPSLSTDSIQAKLGDLVEDTNDVNNFEAARNALQKKRSALIPYRGQGGSVYQTQREISKLDEDITRAKGRTEELRAARSALMEKKWELQRKTEERDDIQGKIRLASQAAGRRAVTDRYEQLREELDRDRRREAQLSAKYPNGIPNAAQVDTAIKEAQEIETLKVRLEYPQDYLEAKRRLDADTLFASGIPSEETFQHYQQLCASYAETRTKLQNTGLSREDKDKLAALERSFSHGVPDEGTISQCREARRAITAAKAQLQQAALPPDESARMARLERRFIHGVPPDEAIVSHRQMLEKARHLREEDQRITVAAAAPAVEQEAPPKKGGSAFLVALILGIVPVICGAVLLFARSYAVGGCLAGLGVILFILSVYLRLKDMVSHMASASSRAAPSMSEQDRRRLRENEEEIQRLERSVAAFLDQYTDGAGALAERLQELQNEANELRRLRDKERELGSRRIALESQIAAQDQLLTDALSPYYGDRIPDDAESELTVKCRQYADLVERRDAAERRANDLAVELRELSDDISAFLAPYAGELGPDDLASQLDLLRKRRDDHVRDKKLVSSQEALRKQNGEQLRSLQAALAAFARAYALPPGLTGDVLQGIQSDIREYAELQKGRAGKMARLEDFYRDNESILSMPAPEEQYDLDGLKAAEKQMTDRINAISGEITGSERRIAELQSCVDGIPDLEDKLADLMAKCEEDRKNAGLLDAAIGYLERAKVSLSTSYLAPIKRAFTGYLQEFSNESGDRVYIDPALEVTMDRSGKARELGYFSAGQTDTIMLCMRLALVDALFKDGPVFLILDDPFVDLDDEHTSAAKSLLKKISKDRQIIYLVCNSSRNIR